MHNNLDYLYTQLNELNSKIGSTYNYIDSNILSDSKINELNLKCDYMIARANKIEQKIKLIENEKPKQEKNDKVYWILTIVITLITIIIVLLAL